MLWNYLKTALRSLKRQKLFSLINILGLAAGMAGFALFALTAGVKLNADRFHSHADRIHAVVQVARAENKDDVHTAFIPGPLIPALQAELPGIEDSLRLKQAGRVTISRGKEHFYENGLLFVDANFLRFFSFSLLLGNADTALLHPFSIVISEDAARKYFGSQNPIGQELVLENKTRLTVTAVSRRLSRTSSITFAMLVPLAAMGQALDANNWQTNPCIGFVRLGRGQSATALKRSLQQFIGRHFPSARPAPKQLYLFPLLDIRTKGSTIVSFWHASNRTAIFITLALGALLLIVVSVNFVSLSTARFMQRAKEIGLRKTSGALRAQLVIQFLGESILLALLSLPLAIVIYELAHPLLITADVLGAASATSNSIWNYPFLLKYMLAAAVLTGLVSGLYPAIVLSSIRPIQILKGSVQVGPKKNRFSKVMIVLQFFLASVLIMASSIFRDQYGHLLSADFGHDRSHIAVLPLSGKSSSSRERIRTEISRRADVVSVSAAAELPIMWSKPLTVEPADPKGSSPITMLSYGVDFDFIETLKMKMVSGRSFERSRGDGDSLIINETAVRRLGWQDPLGKSLKVGQKTGTVVGVVRDFLFDDIGFRIPPAVLSVEPENLKYLLIKFSSPQGFPALRGGLKEIWNRLVPGVPFECQTLQDHFNGLFRIIVFLSDLFRTIGLVAIFFSCLGLFGLVSYLVQNRTKAIGIRRVLGASTGRVVWEIIREYMVLVAVANAITVVAVFFGWKKFLQTGILFFTEIGTATYLSVILLALAPAFAAVAFRALRAASARPVESLRHE